MGSKKVFTKQDFERVRGYISRGWKDQSIHHKTGWSVETLRLARKYETWAAYRSYVVRKRKKAQKRREELKVQLANDRNQQQLADLKSKREGKTFTEDLAIPGYTTDDGYDFLRDPNEGVISPSIGRDVRTPFEKARDFLMKNRSAAVSVVIVLFVLILIVT